MSNGARPHEHQCPECKITWICGEYGCWKTGYARRRLCHGKRCAQATKPKPAPDKPADQGRLF